ncbi:hypothetical protein Droror1_Dr00026410 [Drosera rotundifolia]
MLQLPPSPHMPKSQKLIYIRRGLPCLNLRVVFREWRMRKAVFEKRKNSDVVPGRPCCFMLDMMNSRMDAQASCQCIKAAVQNITGYNWFYSSQIPKKCGAYPSFPISRGVNCSSLN